MADSRHRFGAASADSTTVFAPAKVNLTLAVKHRRADGYHEIESLVVAIGLYDELTIASRGEPGIELECDVRDLPCDSRNLIHRAANRLAEVGGIRPALHIYVRKRIPIASGLGGGSSDAATTLMALNERWDLRLSRTELLLFGEQLGSDVPFFFHAPAAIIRSRGEQVEPVTIHWTGWVVLMLPGLPISTAQVYQCWQGGDPEPSAAAVLALSHGGAAAMSSGLGNMLESTAHRISPRLCDIHRRVQALSQRALRISGSGSAMYGLFDNRDEAAELANRVRQRVGIDTRVVRCPSSRPDRSAGGFHGNH